MYTILIAGYDPASSMLIRERVSYVPGLRVIAETDCAQITLRKLSAIKPDVLFLDTGLCASEPSGFLSRIPSTVVLILTSIDRLHAHLAYDHNAIDFMMRPLERQRLDRALKKLTDTSALMERITVSAPIHLFVPEGNGYTRIDSEQVRYIKAARDYSVLYTEGREWISSLGIGKIMQKLDTSLFIRVHRSYIVNLCWVEHVVRIGPRTSVFIKGGPEIVVGRTFIPVLKTILL